MYVESLADIRQQRQEALEMSFILKFGHAYFITKRA